MTELRLAPGLALDADYVGGGTFALLAKKGAGKTYLGRVMCEEFWKAKVPFVALDPMDAWWGLRASADGKGDGIPVAIFGGPHADAPLEREGGKLMADLVVEEGLSMVLSLKHFGTRAAERQFALDFLERLYRRNSELVHLLIDEADLFAPQKPQAGDQPLLGVTENIVRRGRNSGIGITLITQRPAVLNKDVLTQVDGLCVMRMLGPQDRNAIDDWVGEHGDTNLGKEVKGTLPDLPTGECWWWVPEQGVLQRVKVRKARTFDSSPTRKRGQEGREPKSFADVDMGAIEKKMADTIERAKADDPKELRKTIAALRKELAARPDAETRVETVEVEKIVEVPTLVFNGEVERLDELMREAAKVGADFSEAALQVASAVHTAKRPDSGRDEKREPQRTARPVTPRPQPVRPAPARRPSPSPVVAATEDGEEVHVKAGARRILETFARHYPMRMTKGQLGTLSRFKITGGTFQTYYSLLKRLGYLVEEGALIAITDAGLDYIGEVPREPMTTEELLEQWRGALKAGARHMLDVLVERRGDPITREELAELVGMTASGGTFGTYLGTLRRNGLIEVEGDEVWASASLFLAESYA